KWLHEGKAQIVTTSGFLNKEQSALRLNSDTADKAARRGAPSEDAAEIEQALYGMFLSAAGVDQVLESKEMKRWSTKNYAKIDRWLKDIPHVAQTELTGMGCAELIEIAGIFGRKRKQLKLTPQGEEMTDRMYGFKKFLEEFTIIDERDADEVKLWNSYLIFAQVLGIADKVTRRIAKLCPALLQNTEFKTGSTDMIIISNVFAKSMNSGYVSGRSSSEASSGGGGGFSGGGGGGASGGGSFGGGGTR
ncbi:MAG: DUF2207 domain-containing protein, partial [Clostridiales bacterium]|nr:DUF2207 domain-containing protein [Clostridiales bacterium]